MTSMTPTAVAHDEPESRSALEVELGALSRLMSRPVDERDASGRQREIAQQAVDSVRRLLGATTCRLYAVESVAGQLRELAASGPAAPTEPRSSLVDAVLRGRQALSLIADDVAGDVALAVPLLHGDRAIGALEVRRAYGIWSPDETRTAQIFADQVTVAVAIGRLVTESRKRRRTAEALAVMAHATSRSFDVSTLGREIVDTLLVLLGCARAALFELVGGRFRLVAVARANGFEAAADVAGPELGPVESLAMREQRLVATSDFLSDPTMSPRASHHPVETGAVPIRAMLAVPLFHDDVPIGMLSVGDRVRRMFAPEETEVFRAAADHAAVALKHARLHAQVAEAARVRERVGIANELHDTLSQLAFSVGLKLDWCLHRVADGTPLRPKLEDIRRDTGLMMAQIRQLIGHLSPDGLAETTFAERLERLVKDFRELTTTAAELELRGDPSTLPPAARDVLQKTLQEALVNIAKHARARRAVVRIEVGVDEVSIGVSDDGVGLPASAANAAGAVRPGHLGLRQMRERIEAAGGWLEIIGRQGAGVSIRGAFPLRPDRK
jgi:signal transduction histidine kinase